jgi:hypothetical protein
MSAFISWDGMTRKEIEKEIKRGQNTLGRQKEELRRRFSAEKRYSVVEKLNKIEKEIDENINRQTSVNVMLETCKEELRTLAKDRTGFNLKKAECERVLSNIDKHDKKVYEKDFQITANEIANGLPITASFTTKEITDAEGNKLKGKNGASMRIAKMKSAPRGEWPRNNIMAKGDPNNWTEEGKARFKELYGCPINLDAQDMWGCRKPEEPYDEEDPEVWSHHSYEGDDIIYKDDDGGVYRYDFERIDYELIGFYDADKDELSFD